MFCGCKSLRIAERLLTWGGKLCFNVTCCTGKNYDKKTSWFTIRDVARHAAVSVATVSRFISQNAPVSQEVFERIQQVMLDLN